MKVEKQTNERGRDMISLTYEGLTFKEIERNFYEISYEVAKTLMEQFLRKTDDELAKKRDTSELRHKGARPTTIKTLWEKYIS